MISNKQVLEDLNRDAWNLFGLPVDNLTIEATKVLLCEKVKHDKSIVLSTINVNWVVQSFVDQAFRQAIINSDIVTLDGKPLLWLTRLLGYPMVSTVAGSDLIQNLHQDKKINPALTIFFFGGNEGIAEKAMQKLNTTPGGLKGVGAFNPGFGSVQEMSSDMIIDEINKVKPDILLVALGAKKGSQWIERNRHRLNAKIISHLGATINFMAGTVRRAPKVMRIIGMEWAWRIIQEPKLFSRYLCDGLILIKRTLYLFYSWLYFLFIRKYKNSKLNPAKLQIKEKGNSIILTGGKHEHFLDYSSIQNVFVSRLRQQKNIAIDLQKTKYIDGRFLALLVLFVKHQQLKKKKITLINVGSSLLKTLQLIFSETDLCKMLK